LEEIMKIKSIISLLFITMIASFTCAGAAEVGGIEINGFISQGYLTTSDNNFMGNTSEGSFEFNEIGINFGKELIENMRVGVQLFSRDLGNYGNNEITVDWAYGDYRWKDWLGVRVGKIKAPHGLYNETRDVDMLRNWIFLPQSVYPEIERDAALSLMGVGVYGNARMGRFGGLSYQALIGTQNIDANESLAQSLMGINTFDPYMRNQDINVDKKYAVSLTWDTPVNGLRVGGTAQVAKMDLVSYGAYPAGLGIFSYMFMEMDPATGIPVFDPETGMPLYSEYAFNAFTDVTTENYVVSAEYTWNNLMVVAEYMWSDRELTINTQGVYPDMANSFDETFAYLGQTEWAGVYNPSTPIYRKPAGWYVGATYRFTDWFELGGYYSENYGNRNDRDGSVAAADLFQPLDPVYRAYNNDICLTARFDINQYWSVKLEGHHIEGVAGLPLSENTNRNYQHTFVKDWEMYAAKVTYNF
jgi:hypothetical protein